MVEQKSSAPAIWPVILSGGAGTRLWPLSRAALPKQLLALTESATMLQATAARVAGVAGFQAPVIVTGPAHVAAIREQLGDAVTLIVEPAARNTAAAIALAVLAIAADDPDAVLLVMPSDHQVSAPAVFRDAVATALPAARAGWLVTFGIRAATPETGYGYIKAGPAIMAGVQRAERFIEKPDLARARELVADGSFAWNAGIFLFSAAAMRSALAAHAPEVLAGAEAALAGKCRDAGRIDPDAAAFAAVPSISIDHAVFEHADNVAICPVDPGWSDIGSWDALHGLGTGNAQGNVSHGRVEAVDSFGCLLRADGVLLATIGVNNLNIIATPDAVLVTARGRSQDVRTIAAVLAGDPLLDRPVIEAHHWGEARLVHDGDGLSVRRLTITPGATLPAPGGMVTLVSGSAGSLVPGVAQAGDAALHSSTGAVIIRIG
jgi:mannose-1-phosphate guanylyltransferase